MQCQQCGLENPEGNQFCAGCGGPLASLPQQTAAEVAPPAAAPAAQAASPPASSPPAKRRRGCWACGIGCGVVLLLLACAALITAGWYFRWPQQLGLVESPGATLFEASPDPYASEMLLAELEEDGVAIEGLSIYVVPTDEGELIAYVLADESDGFVWSGLEYDNAIEGLLLLTADTMVGYELGIDRVAVDYRGAEGEQIAVMTADVPSLSAYYYDGFTREQLFEQMNGRAGSSSGFSFSLGGE